MRDLITTLSIIFLALTVIILALDNKDLKDDNDRYRDSVAAEYTDPRVNARIDEEGIIHIVFDYVDDEWIRKLEIKGIVIEYPEADTQEKADWMNDYYIPKLQKRLERQRILEREKDLERQQHLLDWEREWFLNTMTRAN